MDKERSRRDGTAKVTLERILHGGQDIAGNGTAMWQSIDVQSIDVQNIAYAHISHKMVDAARGPLS